MRTDTMIQYEGMQALMKSLGLVDAEKFLSLVQREPFDYTKWHRILWKDMTHAEIFEAAKKHECSKL